MRRGSWILAISGMMALHQNSFAADSVADESSGRTAIGTPRTPATGKRPVKGVEAPSNGRPKNYYKELFGDETPPAAPQTQPQTPVSKAVSKPASQAAIKPISAAANPADKTADWADDHESVSTITPVQPAIAKSPADKVPSAEPSFDDLPVVTGKASVTPVRGARASGNVSQVGYDHPAGKTQELQPMRADGRPKSAPSLPEFDESAAKVPRTKLGKNPGATTRVKPVSAEEPSPSLPTVRTSVTSTPSAISTAPVVATPSTGPVTSQVTLEWVKRGEFNVGQECQVELVVKNAGSTTVNQLAIDAFFPSNIRLIAAIPTPESATDRLTWSVDQLTAGSEKSFTVKLIPSKRGEIGASAEVRFTGTSSAAFAVHEPMLKVAVKSPSKEVMLGDPASQMITVTNPGTGSVHDVKIEAKLSAGLEHPTREDQLVIDVGTVGPGETRSYRLGLTAALGGLQGVTVVATSSSDASSTDSVEFNVIAPSLKITVDGPAMRYKGRNAKYTVTVTNDGSLVNNNVRVSQTVAAGFKFVSADHGGKFDSSANNVQWFIDRLAPGESAQMICEMNSKQIGQFSHVVHVVSDAGVQADAEIETRVDGIASLTMEIVDRDDPVEVGAETAYEIRVKNDGSKLAAGVVVTCDLPVGMEFLSAEAPVDQVLEGRQLIFKPIGQIAAGGQTTIRIAMKVGREGSHRLRARLTGGGLAEPIQLEEVTRAYTD